MSLGCGACNLCCRLLAVPDINKPARMLCWHTGIHGGCARQAEKSSDPNLAACAQFKCLWLASQDQDDERFRQPRHARPDFTHVVMGPQDREDRDLIYVQVDPRFPAAWRESVVLQYLTGVVERGGKVEIIIDEHRFRFDELEKAA